MPELLSLRDSLVLYLAFSSVSSQKTIAMTVVAMHMTCFNSICNHFMVQLAPIMACGCHNRMDA